jgi:hypothetical protein
MTHQGLGNVVVSRSCHPSFVIFLMNLVTNEEKM